MNLIIDTQTSTIDIRGVQGRVRPKQGLVQDYSQRIEGANIYRQKLSRLKLSRLRPHRHRSGWAKGHGLRLYRQQLYGSETGGGGGSSEIIYSSPSIRKKPLSSKILEKPACPAKPDPPLLHRRAKRGENF